MQIFLKLSEGRLIKRFQHCLLLKITYSGKRGKDSFLTAFLIAFNIVLQYISFSARIWAIIVEMVVFCAPVSYNVVFARFVNILIVFLNGIGRTTPKFWFFYFFNLNESVDVDEVSRLHDACVRFFLLTDFSVNRLMFRGTV